jgi:hypothetical protein
MVMKSGPLLVVTNIQEVQGVPAQSPLAMLWEDGSGLNWDDETTMEQE